MLFRHLSAPALSPGMSHTTPRRRVSATTAFSTKGRPLHPTPRNKPPRANIPSCNATRALFQLRGDRARFKHACRRNRRLSFVSAEQQPPHSLFPTPRPQPSLPQVLQLKEVLAMLQDIPVAQQTLVFRKRELRDEEFLADAGVGDGSTLQLVLKMNSALTSMVMTPPTPSAYTAQGVWATLCLRCALFAPLLYQPRLQRQPPLPSLTSHRATRPVTEADDASHLEVIDVTGLTETERDELINYIFDQSTRRFILCRDGDYLSVLHVRPPTPPLSVCCACARPLLFTPHVFAPCTLRRTPHPPPSSCCRRARKGATVRRCLARRQRRPPQAAPTRRTSPRASPPRGCLAPATATMLARARHTQGAHPRTLSSCWPAPPLLPLLPAAHPSSAMPTSARS